MNKELKKLKMIKYGSEFLLGFAAGIVLTLHERIARKELIIEAIEFCSKEKE